MTKGHMKETLVASTDRLCLRTVPDKRGSIQWLENTKPQSRSILDVPQIVSLTMHFSTIADTPRTYTFPIYRYDNPTQL